VDNNFLMIPDGWQDWVVVFGYIGFTVFIAWRVLTPK
jgi:hypothetical protein